MARVLLFTLQKLHYNGLLRNPLHNGIRNISKSLCSSKSDTHINDAAQDEYVLHTCPDHIKLSLHGVQSTFGHLWLRDHCRCSICWNQDTHQKRITINDIPQDIRPREVKNDETGNISITWSDDHNSVYSPHWLTENDVARTSQPKYMKQLWDNERLQNIGYLREPVSNEDFLNQDQALSAVLKDIITLGFGLVQGVPADLPSTQKVTERIGPVLQTIFGGMWSFTSDGSRADTAYTTKNLGAHTDTCYYQHMAGIQVFHCFSHTDGDGGLTLLVDGFHCAEILRHRKPECFRLLSTAPVSHEYSEPQRQIQIKSLAPVIGINPLNGHLEQIRYNHYDRTVLNTLKYDDITKFYKAITSLTEIVENPKNEVWIKLKPGTVIFIDNWRVMHGRSAFTGRRVLGGNYIARDDWLNTARGFNLV